MLPTLRVPAELEFTSIRSALDAIEARVVKRVVVDARDLIVSDQGRLSHAGYVPADVLHDVPLTETSLAHLDALVGLPQSYSGRINPQLHAENLTAQLRDHIAPVTILIEADADEPENRHVSAVVLGGRLGVDDRAVLQVLERRGLDGSVVLRPGSLDVRVASQPVEALADDVFQVSAQVYNDAWGSSRSSARPGLEVSSYLLRLICQNGTVSRRSLSQGKLSFFGQGQLEAFLNQKVDDVLAFTSRFLPAAVERMSEELLEGEQRQTIQRILERYLGKQRADETLTNTVSAYDGLNAITATARDIVAPRKRRALEIHAGGMLDRYLELAA